MKRKSARRFLSALLLLCGAGAVVLLMGLPPDPVSSAGPEGGDAGGGDRPDVFTGDAIAAALAPVREEVAREATPGAAVAFGFRDREAHLAGVGKVGWGPNASAVDPTATVYDLASMTKVLATAAAVMLLVDDGRIALDDPVSKYLPSFTGGGRERVTIRHLVSHTSGLPPTGRSRGNSRGQRIQSLLTTPIYFTPGREREYSDAGYVVLWEAAERAAGEPLDRYLRRRLYEPLGMNDTGFLPGLDCETCAPTGRLRNGQLYRGKPFDPLAQRLDGISGHAGLFSTSADVGRFAAMITSGGALGDVRVLREETVREFTRLPDEQNRAMLGWQTFCREEARHRCGKIEAFGHTGWTGTSLWIDPESGRWVVILTNRTYETRAASRLRGVRWTVFDRVVDPEGAAKEDG